MSSSSLGSRRMPNAGETCRYIGVLVWLVKAMKERQGSQGSCAWGPGVWEGGGPCRGSYMSSDGVNTNQ